MNVIDVLHKIGYDVLAFDGEGHYKVQFNKLKFANTRQAMKLGQGFDGDRYAVSEIYVHEVGFNGFGDLYVTFKEVGTENENVCFDMYEYGNDYFC